MEPSAPYDDDPIPVLKPASTAPKTIGVLNIVFGSLMLLCGICTGLNLMAQSTMGPMMQVQQQQLQQAIEKDRQEQLQRLRDQENAAQDEQEKADLRAQQKALEMRPVPKMPDFTQWMRDSRILTYFAIDMGSGLFLNVLMIISGIGLLRLAEWGRVLALWVAGLKIVRLIALYSYYALVIVPVIVQQFTSMFREMFEEIARNAPPGQRIPQQAELNDMGTAMGAMMTGMAVVMILFGVIYPIVVLAILSRQRLASRAIS